MKRGEIPLIHISGSHREMGRQMGEACRKQVAHSIKNSRELLEDARDTIQLTWKLAAIQARKYIPFAEEIYPQYVEELKGIAEGANVSYDDLVVLNAMEAVTNDALHLTKCTSMGVTQQNTANGHVLLAHNEDWVPEDEADIYLVHARPDDEPPFLAMTYGGLLPNIGFNAFGIAQLCDTVYPNDSRIGIPRIINSRAVLGSRTPSEAMRHMLAPHRAAGYNYLLAHDSGEIYNVEVSAHHFAILYDVEGYMVHTNHYLDYQMVQIESESDELISTRVRYHRALRLLKQSSQHNITTLQAIQRDHVNFPDSICNHSEIGDPLDREKTIMGLIIDLTSRQMHAVWGNPCENNYSTYQLED